MKITTKTGDKGETSLFGGKKVSKGDHLLEVIGGIDELQAFLGNCRFVVQIENGKDVCDVINKLQDDLFRIMSFLGNEMKYPKDIEEIKEKDVNYIEREIEIYDGFFELMKGFVKPGMTEAGARFHIARTVCRRVERSFVRYIDQLSIKDGGCDIILKYFNRLSDLLFILACKFEEGGG